MLSAIEVLSAPAQVAATHTPDVRRHRCFVPPSLESLSYLLTMWFQAKLRALRVLDEELGASQWRATPDFARLVSLALAALLRTLNEEEMNVWSLAREVLVRHVNALVRTLNERVVFELFRAFRPDAALGGRAQRVALE